MGTRSFVRILKRAQRDILELGLDERRLVGGQIQLLAADPSPRGADAMHGLQSLTLRVRVGRFRICYSVREDEIVIVTVTQGSRPHAEAIETLTPCSSPDSGERAKT